MPILGILASSQPLAAGDYESIATVTVGSGGAANVEFTSIPTTGYKHLQIRALGQTSRSGFNVDTLRFQINSDTGSNYAWHHLRGDGSATEAKASTTQTDIQAERALGTTTGGSFGGVIMDILDYANTNKYKTFRLLGGVDANGSGAITFTSGLWQNTNAITSIKLYGDAANFSNYTHFALYGIKGAA